MKITLSALAASAALAVGLYASGVQTSAPAAAAAGVTIPAPAADIAETGKEAVAVFAGGCFWGVEGVFEHVAGVKKVESGYAGGTAADAKYERIGTGSTGHAEVVRIVYDPAKISYGRLLHIFFSVAHNPTELNRQGPDVGPQYRSAIFPQSPQQRRAAAAYIDQLGRSGKFRSKVVTKLEQGSFYAAEAYHQDFMRRNPRHGYIVAHDAPKLRALQATFPRLYSARPAV
jgi:peptide-methionine (S)-S-oxide reductase